MNVVVKACAAVALLSVFSGCAKQTYSSRPPLNEEPLTIDQAMQQRDWDRSTAYYQNGDVPSWSTGFAYRSQADARWKYYFADYGAFAANLVTLPWTMYQEGTGTPTAWDPQDPNNPDTKEGTGIVSAGDILPPTYTAVPALPPSDETLPATPTTQPDGE